MTNDKPQVKPQLHQSHLAMLSRCGEQFYRVYILGHREPPGIARIIGSAVHKSVKSTLQKKLDSGGVLPPVVQVRDEARSFFQEVYDEEPLTLTESERESGIDAVKGSAIDATVALSALHRTEFAPIIQPIPGGLERPWVVKCEGYPFDLAGTFDIDEGRRIRDTKTRNRNPGQHEADTSEQLTFYAMAKKIIDRVDLDSVHLDFLIKPTESSSERCVSLESTRGMSDYIVAKNRFERAVEVIEKEAFIPASQADWFCSERFCGFAADGSCPFFRGKKSFSMNIKIKKGERKHGKSKHVIKAFSTKWYDAIR